MLPRLRAEEAMAMATQIGIGTGSLGKSDSRRVQAEWERAANDGQRAVVKATPADLQAVGIGVRRRARAKAHG